ncbi:hypothetical protein PBRA_009086 [Plasmodiophora brassicae]|nr:hypothetical protein PBRA_009086 [Plasmodiophora brassicae]
MLYGTAILYQLTFAEPALLLPSEADQIGSQMFVFFYESPYWGAPYPRRTYECGGADARFEKVMITSAKRYRHVAGALVFQPSRYYEPRDRKSVPWVMDTLENPAVRTISSSVFRQLDYAMSYRYDSDGTDLEYATGLLSEGGLEASIRRLTASVDMSMKDRSRPIFWVASNCVAANGRTNLVRELMKHIPVASYGPCLNNAHGDNGRGNTESVVNLPEHWAKVHKFYLAFENDNCVDYISEKYYKTIKAGLVPVVDGPRVYPNWVQPTAHSIIHVDDFASISDLAAFLHKLNNDDDLYLEYLSHRTGKAPLQPAFTKFLSRLSQPTTAGERWCRVASMIASGKPSRKIDMKDDQCQHGKWKHLS